VIAVLIGLVLLLPVICFVLFISFTFVPPILVRVVDAVSGQAIEGIAVTQRVTIARSDTPSQQLSVTKTTGGGGYVLFRPYLYSWPVFATEGYTINVNEKSMAATPWRKEVDLGPYQTNKYLPMMLESHCPNCELLWRAPSPAAENLRSLWFVTVPLIPALERPDRCSSIANPTVSKQCKELNTYRSAFLHFDSIQDVENNKAICRQLEDPAVKTCLGDLAAFVAGAVSNDSSPYEHRHMPMLPTLPLSEVFPFDRIGDREVISRRTWGNNAVTGHIGYSAVYARGGRLSTEVHVSVDDFPTEEAARQDLSTLTSGFGYRSTNTVSEEIRSGNRIRVYRIPHFKNRFGESGGETTFWRSANKIVTINIFLPVPKDEEFVSKFLAVYPSSLTPNESAKTARAYSWR
jgi:hypothetical protein